MEDPDEIRRENFFQTLRMYFFPFYRLYSATTVIVVLHLVFFITIVSIHGVLPSYQFLKIPTPVRELYSRSPYYIQKEFQLWRLVTCVFLHEAFTPVLFAVILNLLLISLLENMVKSTRTLFFYFGTSFLGNLFGIVCSDKNVIGTTVPLYGALGGLISHGILEWESSTSSVRLNTREPLIISLIIMLLIMALGFVLPNVDSFGHVGGFISGMLLGFNLLKSMATRETVFNKLSRSLSLVLLFLFANFLIYMFFFQRHTKTPVAWVHSK